MAQTTSAYFVGEFLIPNISGTSHPAVTSNLADLNWFIAKYEPVFLKEIMGETMYAEFVAGLAVGSPAAKWTELRDQLWDSTNKISPVAAYIWYAYRQNNVTQSGAFGETTANTENASVSSSKRKLIDAWNTAYKGAFSVFEWIEERLTTYTTYDGDKSKFYTLNDFGI